MSEINSPSGARARIWEEDVVFPTYGVGEPDPNPMFFERRVYQGSSGRVYPYPLIETVSDEKRDVAWWAVILENEYIKVMVLPQLGGRIHMALDKTNGYHFIYFNQVIKPALVGLAGPWISGGIEFNWPQHHRPSTFQPVDYTLVENADGSVTAWLGEIEQMSRLRGLVGITLRPGVARIDIEGVSSNRTLLPQTMLWWTNPAVSVNDDYQSVFPPDVQAVMDHGKRDVSRFPIAVGTYYNQDYSHGVDISWWKNIPVPSSYMVAHSDYDFCGGYDHGRRAGVLHVADHHVSPGKKQWTWGNGDFGRVWNGHLTDADGPYIELMTGIFTDNQPDFSWLQPGETKRFTQHFYPVREIGVTRQANTEAALALEIGGGDARLGVYTTAAHEDALVRLRCGDDVVFETRRRLAPDEPFVHTLSVAVDAEPHAYRLEVMDRAGRELLAWSPEAPREVEIPAAAKPAAPPADIKTIEELFLTGLHLEQYRHATRDPEPYYEEGLRRDPGDARCNNAMGLLQLRRANPHAAMPYFRRAIERLTLRNGNPYDGEPLFNLGLALEWLGDWKGAADAFGKAAWNESWHASARAGLARLACRAGEFEKALAHAQAALDRGVRNERVRHLVTMLLRLLGRSEEALQVIAETLRQDPLHPGAWHEKSLVLEECGRGEEANESRESFRRQTRHNVQTLLELAIDYAACGRLDEAIELLSRTLEEKNGAVIGHPMALYFLAAYEQRRGIAAEAQRWQKAACAASPVGCFPHRIEEALVLEEIVEHWPGDSRAWYYLGNHHYDARRHDEAIVCWEKARTLDAQFPTCRRNLALAYFNKRGEPEAALRELEAAFDLNPQDVRVFFELDQLRKKMNVPPGDRRRVLADHPALVIQRDSLYLEWVALHNRMGQYKEALGLLGARHFHPWEGGEGRVSEQYQFAQVQIARQALAVGDGCRAVVQLEAARAWPEQLGEGRLTGIQENHIDYYLGLAQVQRGEVMAAREAFERAASGFEHLSMSMFYYDQPPDMLYYQGLALKKLGREREAMSRFNRLIDHGERHLHDACTIDYFAISLPNFLVFDDDLNLRNRVHCLYLMALGHAGKGNMSKAEARAREVLALDVNHLGAWALLPESLIAS